MQGQRRNLWAQVDVGAGDSAVVDVRSDCGPKERMVSKDMSESKMLSREDVTIAYRLILGREPEDEDSIVAHQVESSLERVGRRLLTSKEFRRRAMRELPPSTNPKWVCTEIRHGLKLWIDLTDYGVSAGCLHDDWEPAETDFILAVLSPGDVFLDIGANIGWFSILAAHAVGPEGRVYAFEPREDRHRRLAQSVMDNGFEGRCFVETTALGATASEKELAWVPTEHNPGHSFLAPETLPEDAERLGRVSVRSLDSFDIAPPVRVIKIDVEGAELQVLEGARDLIARDRPILVIEIFPQWLQAVGSTTPEALIAELRRAQYRIFRLGEVGLGREMRAGAEIIEPGGPEYFNIVALSEEDCRRLLAHRFDHRVADLERRLNLEGMALAASARAAEAAAQATERSVTAASQAKEAAEAIARSTETRAAEAVGQAQAEARARETAEAIARSAETRAAEAIAQAEAEIQARKAAEAIARAAEARAADAIARAESEAQAREAAEAVARKAETRAGQAHARAETADRATEAAEALVRAAETRLATATDAAVLFEARAIVAEQQCAALMANFDATTSHLRVIESSTIWRAGHPLRQVGRHLPRSIRRALRRGARVGWWAVTLQLSHRMRQYLADRAALAATNQSPPAPVALDAAADESSLRSDPTSSEASPVMPVAVIPDAAVRPFEGSCFVVSPLNGSAGPAQLPTSDGPRALIIDSSWPRPDRDSGSLDAVLQAQALRNLGYEVIFASSAEHADASIYRTRLQSEGLICLSSDICPSIADFLQSDGSTLDLCVLSRVDSGGPYLETVRQYAPCAKVIFNTVDLHHLREERGARLSGDVAKLRAAETMRERELYLVRQADATTVVSASEHALLEKLVPGALVFEMPLVRKIRRWDAIPGYEAREGVGFVGGFEHKPNVDAVQYLLSEIWPRVLERLPRAKLSIVGDALPVELLANSPSNARYLGPLPDLDPWLDGLRLTVAPLRYGAGAKGKVASSLVAGVPCVGTAIAADGMRLEDGVNMSIGDTPEDLAARICEVHESPDLWRRLSAGGHAKATAELAVEMGEARLAALLHAVGLPAKILKVAEV